MDQFSTLSTDPFLIGESDLDIFRDRPKRLEWGVIFICTEGEALISTEIINHEIKKNSKVTLLPGTILTVHQKSDNFRVYFFAFSKPLFEEAHFRLGPSFLKFLKERPVYQMPEEKAVLLLGLFPFLTAIYNDKENQFRYNIVKNQLQSLFWDTYDKIHRIFKAIRNRNTIQQEDLFSQFISLIKTHCREEREVAFYAGQLCITPRYLSFIARQVTRDKSAKELINNHLILEIKVMLESTQLTIQEIAHRLNFPDQSYLGRYFKRYTGISPTEYRNRRGKEINGSHLL